MSLHFQGYEISRVLPLLSPSAALGLGRSDDQGPIGAIAVPITAAILTLAIGVYPLSILELLRPSAEAWVAALAGL